MQKRARAGAPRPVGFHNSAGFALALALHAAVAGAQTVGTRVETLLARPPLDRAHWGVVVEDARTGERLYARNAELLFVPASNLKLVVAAAAAHHLPADFRYFTTLHVAEPARDGVIGGDLVLRGTGDPTLSGRYQPGMLSIFEAWADSLRAGGVRRIGGDVVADATLWDGVLTRGDWEAYDLLWWYAAPVGPLGFNDNAVDFRIEPGPVGQPARISWEPRTSFFTFVNRTRTSAAGTARTLDFDRIPGTDTIFAYGEIAAGSAAYTENFAVTDPARFAATVLMEMLERKGIDVAGGVRVVRPPARSPAADGQPLVTHASPPLDSILGPILRNSQNWFAEQLLKTLGHEVRGEGSWDAGLAVEKVFLTTVVGIDESAFRLRDASGLAAGNLMTPAALTALLRYIVRTPGQAVVRSTLPVTGTPTGSLRSRLRGLEGRVRAKTGSIANVASLSGFLTAASGRELVFSVVANGTGQPAGRTNEAIDEIVRVLAASF